MSAWRSILAGYTAPVDLVGTDITHLPFLSGYSVLTRLLRLNCFERRDLFAVAGFRQTPDTTLLRRTMASTAVQSSLASRLSLPPQIPSYWSEAAWSPMSIKASCTGLDWSLRLCPSCALVGYHCTLFQMPWVARCPWHGDHLLDRCRRCDRPLDGSLCADGQPMQCVCGHDFFDRFRALATLSNFPTEAAAEALSTYTRWSKDSARETTLLTPRTDLSDWIWGWSALVDLPSPLADGVGHREAPTNIHRDRFRLTSGHLGAGNETRSTQPWRDLLKQGSVQLAQLPLSLAKPLCHIGHEVSDRAKLPMADMRQGELALPAPGQPYAPTLTSSNERPMLSAVDVHRNAVRIYLGSVLPEAIELCAQLISCMEGSELTHQRSHEVFTGANWSEQLVHRAPQRALVLAALDRLLARGYAWGVRFSFARQREALLNDPLFKPTRWLPVLKVKAAAEGPVSIDIAWVKQRLLESLSSPRLLRQSLTPQSFYPERTRRYA